MFHSKTSVPSRRRLSAVIAVMAALAFSLTACSASSSHSGTSTTKTGSKGASSSLSGPLTVAFLSGQAGISDVISGFEKANPAVTIQTTQGTSNTYQPQIRAQLDAHHGPDVMFVWTGSGNAMATQLLAKANELTSLQNSPWRKSIGSVANSLVSYNGKVYALNSYANPVGVVYNPTLMKKLGVQIPQTFPQLLSMCKTVSSKGIIPIAIGAQTGYLSIQITYEMANDLVYAKDPNFAAKIANGSVKWSTSQLWKDSLTKALNNTLQMQKANCFENDPTGYSDTAADQLVATKKALGVDLIASSFPTLLADAPSMKLDMYSVPASSKASDTILTIEPGSAWAVSAHSDNKKAALAFVNYMAEPGVLDKFAAANFGLPYQASSSTKVPSTMAGVKKRYLAHQTAIVPTTIWPNAEVKQTMIAQSQNLLVGKQTVKGEVAAVIASFGGE